MKKTTPPMFAKGATKRLAAAWLIGLGLVSGCESASNRMWNSREGSYTVKQAVMELGRPQEARHFPDGTQVGSWLVRPGTRGSLYYRIGPTYSGSRAFDYSVLPRDAPPIPDEFLRLKFDRDGTLMAWDRQFK